MIFQLPPVQFGVSVASITCPLAPIPNPAGTTGARRLQP